ncbi:hypothetical protein MHK_009959 [Candidatus Magnetomorum sp. HK-1]|nr:hypothetical protein MHK_009959 [Candidatus Magnetomorum sp. HK-1]
MGRWGRRWDYPERPPRPKLKKLTDDKKKEIVDKLNKAISASPVLTSLKFRFRSLRGRFYLERLYYSNSNDEEDIYIDVLGRITPLASKQRSYLFEKEKSKNNWYKIVQGSIAKIINVITDDTKGTFHGLGILDKNLRQKGVSKKKVKLMITEEDIQFTYAKSSEICSVQEALYHYFNVPIEIIAEPRDWYEYHRTPHIVEVSQDQNKVLVSFGSYGMMGSFDGTCLYAKIKDKWNFFTIKPNQSKNIDTSIAWLEKRGWKDWC